MAVIEVRDLSLFYGNFQALKGISLDIERARTTGPVRVDGEDIYRPGMDLLALRKKVGMVFQRPNPFPLSIADNVTYGLHVHGVKDRRVLDERLAYRLGGVR